MNDTRLHYIEWHGSMLPVPSIDKHLAKLATIIALPTPMKKTHISTNSLICSETQKSGPCNVTWQEQAVTQLEAGQVQRREG